MLFYNTIQIGYQEENKGKWYIDGQDKLKQFGFSLHGYIDGFSRRLIWLEASSFTNEWKLLTNST